MSNQNEQFNQTIIIPRRYVLHQPVKLELAAYAYGGMVNSFVHMLVFANFAISVRANGVTNYIIISFLLQAFWN